MDLTACDVVWQAAVIGTIDTCTASSHSSLAVQGQKRNMAYPWMALLYKCILCMQESTYCRLVHAYNIDQGLRWSNHCKA